MSETLLADSHPRSNIRDTGCFQAVSRKTLRKAHVHWTRLCELGFSCLCVQVPRMSSSPLSLARKSYCLRLNVKESGKYRGAHGCLGHLPFGVLQEEDAGGGSIGVGGLR